MLSSSLGLFLGSLVLLSTMTTTTLQPAYALSVHSHSAHVARHAELANVVQRNRRSTSARCKQRSTTKNNAIVSTTSTSTQQHHSTTTTSSKPATTTKKSSSGNGSAKAGLAWGDGDAPTLADWKTSKTKFLYTWGPTGPDNAAKDGFTFVPMLWGSKQADSFKSNVKAGYSTHAMFINEPDQNTQSDMSPQDAAALWKSHMEPLKKLGYTLVGPACTNAPSGKTWMKDFLDACNGGCTIDIQATHWYATKSSDFISYMEDWYTTFKTPMWVTEFACQSYDGVTPQCSSGDVWNFLETVTKWMDKTWYIEAYFPFGAMRSLPDNVNYDNILMSSNGEPNALGKFVIGK